MLKEGFEEISTALGHKHPRTSEAIERLVSLYEMEKKGDRAAFYRALLSKS